MANEIYMHILGGPSIYNINNVTTVADLKKFITKPERIGSVIVNMQCATKDTILQDCDTVYVAESIHGFGPDGCVRGKKFDW